MRDLGISDVADASRVTNATYGQLSLYVIPVETLETLDRRHWRRAVD